ncbi:hypothetical protein SpCBS45565_g01816 [Spizellomyces sp. 'palustris']|nr:hypothetical protein SpCBS45565_g01816 [Spizellomyces sp. 'palustris']
MRGNISSARGRLVRKAAECPPTVEEQQQQLLVQPQRPEQVCLPMAEFDLLAAEFDALENGRQSFPVDPHNGTSSWWGSLGCDEIDWSLATAAGSGEQPLHMDDPCSVMDFDAILQPVAFPVIDPTPYPMEVFPTPESQFADTPLLSLAHENFMTDGDYFGNYTSSVSEDIDLLLQDLLTVGDPHAMPMSIANPLLHAPPTPPQTTSDNPIRSRTMTPKRFTCPMPGCTKSFTRKYNMNSHIRCHSGEKPFVCPHCPDVSFARKHDLRRHVICLHNVERPFGCDHCTLRFNRSDALKRHLEAVKRKDVDCGFGEL